MGNWYDGIPAGALSFAGGIAGGLIQANAQRQANKANYNAQKEFYQNSMLWRKQDAERAGINPIYALGAGSANFSPSFTAGTDFLSGAINSGINAYQQQKQLKLQQNYQQQLIEESKAKEMLYIAQASKELQKNTSSTKTTNKDIRNGGIVKTAEPNYVVAKTGKREFVQTTDNQELQERVNQGFITPIYHTMLGSFAEADEVAAEINEKREIKDEKGNVVKLNDDEFALPDFNKKYGKYGIYIFKGKDNIIRKIANHTNPITILQRITTSSWKSFWD